MVIAHSMGVINLRITSSVSSSGQWATKLRMAVWGNRPIRYKCAHSGNRWLLLHNSFNLKCFWNCCLNCNVHWFTLLSNLTNLILFCWCLNVSCTNKKKRLFYHTMLQLGLPAWPARWKHPPWPSLPLTLSGSEETHSSKAEAFLVGDNAQGMGLGKR